MKKLSIFAVAFAAFAFMACNGNKSGNTPEQTDSVKSFEQEQVEAKIKVELDSLAAEVGKMKKVPFLQKDENGIQLSEQEKQVKPDYLLSPSVADNAITLAQKYRVLSALSVDKAIAALSKNCNVKITILDRVRLLTYRMRSTRLGRIKRSFRYSHGKVNQRQIALLRRHVSSKGRSINIQSLGT